MRKSNTTCIICKTEIYRRPAQLKLTQGKAYCGKVCFGISCRNEIPCRVCGKLILGSKHAKTCSRACSNKTRTGVKYNKTAPNDKAKNSSLRKAKLIDRDGPQCISCGHLNLNILNIHHILPRAAGGNDNLDNLQLLCPNCHYTLHLGDSRNLEVVRLVEDPVLKTAAP